MEQLTTAALTQLPQVRALGRHTGRDPLTLSWNLPAVSCGWIFSPIMKW